MSISNVDVGDYRELGVGGFVTPIEICGGKRVGCCETRVGIYITANELAEGEEGAENTAQSRPDQSPVFESTRDYITGSAHSHPVRTDAKSLDLDCGHHR